MFDRLLLDADWAINNGNWLWLSASAFFHQYYYRVYSPVTFGKQYDPNGDFIRQFLNAKGCEFEYDSIPTVDKTAACDVT